MFQEKGDGPLWLRDNPVEKKSVSFKLTRDNLRHEFANVHDCPFFHALKEAGVHVLGVGIYDYYDEDLVNHDLPKEVQSAMNIIAFPMPKWVRYLLLHRKTFTVEY